MVLPAAHGSGYVGMRYSDVLYLHIHGPLNTIIHTYMQYAYTHVKTIFMYK